MSRQVLLVEGEPGVHQVVRMILETHGLEVRSAHTAAGALEILETTPPAAVLAGMVLPDGNGLDLCRTLRARPITATVPVLILCGRCRRGDRDRARMAGADAFFTLPFDERAVLGWLRERRIAA